MEILCSNKIPKNVDCFIYLFCNKYKNEISNIEKLLNLKFPKKIFENFNGKYEEIKSMYFENYSIILGGVGDGQNCKVKNINKTIAMIGKLLIERDYKNIVFSLFSEDPENMTNQIENLMIGGHKFDKYLTDKIGKRKIYIYNCTNKIRNIITKAENNGNIVNFIRDLINEPPNKINSISLEKIIKNLFSKSNIQVDILTEKELKRKGLNLILAVNSGSKYPAKLIILSNKNKDKNQTKSKIFIGKGVTFDAGGLSIKTDDFSDMKTDMTGSALVLGLFMYINANNIKGNFVGMLPIVENMVDAKSFRPGDIITAYNKKTVEIIDTDAEGRLILADAIAYCKNYNPEYIIDIATLTGSAASIFNELAIVVMSNNKQLTKNMENACNKCGEKIWELPLWEEYIEYTSSDIADFKNYTTDVDAGAIMGGAFLHNFIPNKAKWMHLDIAGVSYINSENDYLYSGATGYCLRSLFRFLDEN